MNFSNPRVAVYYDVLPSTGFRNDGAPLFVTYNLHKILNGDSAEKIQKDGMRDGGNVVHLSPINPTKQHGNFDLNILVDYGEDSLGIPLDWEIPHPSVYWAFDTHIDSKGYQYRLSRAKKADHVFLCHQGQIDAFIKDGIDPNRIHYLPVAAETDTYRPLPIREKWDWCFIGHLNSEHRIDLMDRFIKEFGLGDGKGYLGWRMPQIQGHNVLEDAARKFSMSKVLLNYSIKSDLNMRVFEAMATGKCLLTDEISPLLKLFEPNRHLVTFTSIDEAIDKYKWLMANDEVRNDIGSGGLKEILAKHTYNHRVLEILKTSLQWEPKGELQPCH